MKRPLFVLLLIMICLLPPAWADFVTLNELQLLPVRQDHVLIGLYDTGPVKVEKTTEGRLPALRVRQGVLAPKWVDTQGQLLRGAFLRPLPYPVTVQTDADGTLLIFQTQRPVRFTVVSNPNEMLTQAVSLLPVYPQWLFQPPTEEQPAEVLVDEAYRAYLSGDIGVTAARLETVFQSLPSPPKVLYQLLGALYLHREDWLKALLLYGEGAHQYPQVLGLRYAALLYKFNQTDQAIRVLSDLTISSGLTSDVLAQASYMLGSIYLERRQYAQALPYLQASTQVFTHQPVVLYNLAIAYEGMNQPEMALEIYRRALPFSTAPLYAEVQAQIRRIQTQS